MIFFSHVQMCDFVTNDYIDYALQLHQVPPFHSKRGYLPIKIRKIYPDSAIKFPHKSQIDNTNNKGVLEIELGQTTCLL